MKCVLRQIRFALAHNELSGRSPEPCFASAFSSPWLRVSLLALAFTVAAHGRVIHCGETLRDSITSLGATNVYTFDGIAGERVLFGAKAAAGSPVCMVTELYGPTGQWLGAESCNQASGVITLPTTGNYTLVLSEYLADHIGDYDVHLQFVSGRCATPIACGQTLRDTLTNRIQHPVYIFSGNAGETVLFAAKAAVGSPVCMAAELYGPTGQWLGAESCNQASGVITLPTTGTYTLVLSEYLADHIGDYDVHLQFVSGWCATPIACGQTWRDTLTNQIQHPVYVFSGNAGETVLFSAKAAAGSPVCMAAELYGPTGQWLGAESCNQASGVITLPTTGTYTLVLSEYLADHTGSYEIEWHSSGQPCPPLFEVDGVSSVPFRVRVTGSTNWHCILQATAGLSPRNWAPLTTNQPPFSYADWDSTNLVQRFYRLQYYQ
jgi:hypothetical protein